MLKLCIKSHFSILVFVFFLLQNIDKSWNCVYLSSWCLLLASQHYLNLQTLHYWGVFFLLILRSFVFLCVCFFSHSSTRCCLLCCLDTIAMITIFFPKVMWLHVFGKELEVGVVTIIYNTARWEGVVGCWLLIRRSVPVLLVDLGKGRHTYINAAIFPRTVQ